MTKSDWKQSLSQELRVFARRLRDSTYYAGSMGLVKISKEDQFLQEISTTLERRHREAFEWLQSQVTEPLSVFRKTDALPLPDAVGPVYSDKMPIEEIHMKEQRRRESDPTLPERIKAHGIKISQPLTPIIQRLEAFADVFAEGKVPPYPKGERHGTIEQVQQETESRPPTWPVEWLEAVHRFTELSHGEKSIVKDRFRELVGNTVPPIVEDNTPDWWKLAGKPYDQWLAASWWWETDNHRPDALLQAMTESGPIGLRAAFAWTADPLKVARRLEWLAQQCESAGNLPDPGLITPALEAVETFQHGLADNLKNYFAPILARRAAGRCDRTDLHTECAHAARSCIIVAQHLHANDRLPKSAHVIIPGAGGSTMSVPSWRNEAKQIAERLEQFTYGWSIAYRTHRENPESRMPLSNGVVMFDSLMEVLLADKEFQTWAKCHIGPMRDIPADSTDAPDLMTTIHRRVKALLQRLNDGGDGSVLAWEIPTQEQQLTVDTSWTEPLDMPALLKLAGLNGPNDARKPLGRMLANLRAAGEQGKTVYALTGKSRGGAFTRGEKKLKELALLGLAELLADGGRWRMAPLGRVLK